VDFVESVGAQQESAAVVEPGEGPFDDPSVAAEVGSVLGLAASDQGFDAALPDESAVLVVVVAPISKQRVRPATRTTWTAAHRRDAVKQFEQLRDVVAVRGGQRPGERQPAAVYEEVMLAAPAAAIDRVWTRFRAPFFACR